MVWLWISTACFLAAFVVAFRAMRQGRRAAAPLRLLPMAAGFVSLSVFLFLRGEAIGQCPLTSKFEILVFVSWSTVLLYFAVGPAYRLSLLGFFTGPAAALLQLAALLLPLARGPERLAGRPGFWMELHASVALVAYGAFALASLAGIMFLIHDRQLRAGKMRTFFHHLPPVHYLGTAIRRLLVIGVCLLTVGLGSALLIEKWPSSAKLWLTVAMWFSYLALVVTIFVRGLAHKTIALAAIVFFVLPISSYWVIERRQPEPPSIPGIGGAVPGEDRPA